MKFSCGVTLFYPNTSELEEILNYEQCFERVYLYDNTEGEQAKLNRGYFEGKSKFIYISNQINNGLSIAFNNMCKQAIKDEFDFICLFDQDSVISNNDLLKMRTFIESYGQSSVAIYAPEIVYAHSNEHKKVSTKEEQTEELDWVITSGSFINLSIYDEIGGFDENYFIDRLDYDYCIMVRKSGYKIVKVNKIYLFQKLGESIKKWGIEFSEHSPIRHYYMFRNRLYFLLKRNKPSLILIGKSIFLSIRHFLLVILLEKEKYRKIKMLVKGSKDFILNNMGKIQ